MNDALNAALRERPGAGFSVSSEDAATIAPTSERELAEVLGLLAEHRARFGSDVALSRAAFAEISGVEGRSATVTAGAGVRLRELEARANAFDLSLGALPPGALELTVAEYLEGPYAGLRVSLGGRLEPLALAVRGMLADGTLYASHPSPRSAAGPDLKSLFLGAGGRLGLVLAATVRLVPRALTGIGQAFRFGSTRELTRAVIAAAEVGLSIDWARAQLEAGGATLWLRLCAPSDAVLLRDRASLRKVCTRGGGTALPEGPDHLPSSEPCRELSWTDVERALDRGAPLRLHRIAMESAVVQGAVDEGLSMDARGNVRPEGANPGVVNALAAAVDAARVLGGVG